MKRGVLEGHFINLVLIALTVFALAIVVVRYAPGTTVGQYIPWFAQENKTITTGTGIIGVDLGDLNLKYYTGAKWEKVGDGDVVQLEGKEFSASIKYGIEDFYFSTPRKSLNSFALPDASKLEVAYGFAGLILYSGNARLFDYVSKVEPFGDPYRRVYDFTPGVYIALNRFIFGNNVPELYFVDLGGRFYSLPNRGKVNVVDSELQNILSSALPSIESWRDEILAGNKCEKHLAIQFRQNGIETSGTFAVYKKDNILFVNLNEFADSKKEKYGKC